MKLFIIFIFCNILFFPQLYASQLPSKKTLKKLETSVVGNGKSLKISAFIDLPKGQKLNTTAPSQIVFYEKISSGWNEIKKIDVNNKVTFPGFDIQLTETLTLQNNNSKIAIDATLYHCSIKRGPCYIDEFQTQLARSPSGAKTLSAKFFPTKI